MIKTGMRQTALMVAVYSMSAVVCTGTAAQQHSDGDATRAVLFAGAQRAGAQRDLQDTDNAEQCHEQITLALLRLRTAERRLVKQYEDVTAMHGASATQYAELSQYADERAADYERMKHMYGRLITRHMKNDAYYSKLWIAMYLIVGATTIGVCITPSRARTTQLLANMCGCVIPMYLAFLYGHHCGFEVGRQDSSSVQA